MKDIEKIKVYDTHVAGEPLRVVMDGLPDLKGNTMLQKLDDAKVKLDDLRQMVLSEPRGHTDMFGAFLVKPSIENPDCDKGVIFIDTSSYSLMCGHGSLCIAYLLCRLNKVKITHPITTVKLDTPAGKVEVFVETLNKDEIKNVTMQGVLSFVYKRDVKIQLKDLTIKLDIAFGGRFFAIIDAKELNIKVDIQNISKFIPLAKELLDKINNEIKVIHPLNPDIKDVKVIQFYESNKNFVMWGDGQFDRSPSGTATSALLALLAEKKQLKENEEFKFYSIIDSFFIGSFEKKFSEKGFNFYIPKVKARPYLTGVSELIFEKNDPFKKGFNFKRF